MYEERICGGIGDIMLLFRSQYAFIALDRLPSAKGRFRDTWIANKFSLCYT